MLGVVLTVAGVLLLALAVWLRMGRTAGARSWVGTEQLERTVLVTLPTAGAACLGLAVMQAGDDGTATLGGGLVGLAVVVMLAFNPVGLPLPRWTLPGWYLTRTAHRHRSRRRAAGRGDGPTGRDGR